MTNFLMLSFDGRSQLSIFDQSETKLVLELE